jgi:hypothetical protein
MVSPLLFVVLLSVTQAEPAPVTLVSRPMPRATRLDSVRALKSARRAQANFESIRRMNLPREFGVGSHHCDVRVGRWCIWNDESNDREPPPEPGAIRRARERLLGALDTLGAAFPGDEWIASQQVRYLVEAGRHADAIRVADRCTSSGSQYVCAALAALAYHDSGAVTAADSAFTAALAAMPDSVRCRWTDISRLLDDDIADRYEHADCGERDRIATTFWRLTNPLYLRNNDWRNEFLARVTRSEMEHDSRTTSGSPDEPAFRETALRYGYDTWFVRDDSPMGAMGDAAIAGYRAGGAGYNFVPDPTVFNAPANLREGDWDLKLRSARTNYAPPYARHFLRLDHKQIALFRRGDSALVIAAYDVSGDTLFARGTLEAGLYAAKVDSLELQAPRGEAISDASPRGVLMVKAAWSPMIVSLEVLDPKTRSAARARYGLRPVSTTDGVAHSDLLLLTPRSADSLPHSLEDALAVAMNGERVTGNRVGLFWEIYGARKEGETFAVTITISRIKEGLVRRAAERLHLASPFSPVEVRWHEIPDPLNGIVSRAITLDVSQLANGRYEIAVAVARSDGPPVTLKKDIIVDR